MDLSAIASFVTQFSQEGTSFIYYLALAIGIVITFQAVLAIVRKGHSNPGAFGGERSWGSIVMQLAIGSCLATLAQKLDLIIATNGDASSVRAALYYAQGSSGGAAGGPLAFIWAAIASFCVLMGTAGFARGFLLWNKASLGTQESGDLFWRGIWHVIGGAITINIFS